METGYNFLVSEFRCSHRSPIVGVLWQDTAKKYLTSARLFRLRLLICGCPVRVS